MSPTALPDSELAEDAIVEGVQSGFRYHTTGPWAPATTTSGRPSPFRSAMFFIHGSDGPDSAMTTRRRPMSSIARVPKGLALPFSSCSTRSETSTPPATKAATRIDPRCVTTQFHQRAWRPPDRRRSTFLSVRRRRRSARGGDALDSELRLDDRLGAAAARGDGPDVPAVLAGRERHGASLVAPRRRELEDGLLRLPREHAVVAAEQLDVVPDGAVHRRPREASCIGCRGGG